MSDNPSLPTEQDVLDMLRQIETGEVTLDAQLDPQEHIKGDIPYLASNGWTLEVSCWGGAFAGFTELQTPEGHVLDTDYLDAHMPKVAEYFPDKDVEWLAYRMKEVITGYIYCSMDKLGPYQGAQEGDIITNPDREPTWLIVNHSLQDTTVARWPGKLWQAEVLDALDPQDHRGNYTRCVSVKLLKEVPTDWLFGVHGAKVEEVLQYASTLTLPQAQALEAARVPDANKLTSDGFHRWMAEADMDDRDPDRDLSGVVSLGGRKKNSPIGFGLSLAHGGVWESAKREVGDAAFDEDEEEMWMVSPWSDTAGALMEAAWAVGAPHLFSTGEIETLLTAWRQVHSE